MKLLAFLVFCSLCVPVSSEQIKFINAGEILKWEKVTVLFDGERAEVPIINDIVPTVLIQRMSDESTSYSFDYSKRIVWNRKMNWRSVSPSQHERGSLKWEPFLAKNSIHNKNIVEETKPKIKPSIKPVKKPIYKKRLSEIKD